jgi:hypothetical protein
VDEARKRAREKVRDARRAATGKREQARVKAKSGKSKVKKAEI